MHLTDYITVFNNIFKNFYLLKSDFIGIRFDINMFIGFIVNISASALFILIYCQIGKKIRLIFFEDSNYKNFNYFLNIALGYISVNSGLGILGALSLFYPAILWMYIGAIFIIAFLPLKRIKNHKNEVVEFFNLVKDKAKKNKWVFLGVFLFVIIAFLRLIPPEIGEDAIGYHTGNPHLFLGNHTTMISSIIPPYVIPAPHLGEMSYVISEFIGVKDSARYVHFSFYFLAALLLANINPYAALLFVTAPVVIQISSKANVDFQWILCWLLSIMILVQNTPKKTRDIILIGILFGGVMASKLWTIAFLPIFLLYLLVIYKKSGLGHIFNILFIFIFSAFLVDLIWLWRSFFISGNPLYPVFSAMTTLGGTNEALNMGNIIGFNKLMFHMRNIGVFSPLFFFGIIILAFHWRYSLKLLRKFNLSLFFVFLATEYIFIQYHFGRYLLGLYTLAVIIISVVISDLIKKHNVYKIFMSILFCIMFIYYFSNTLLILPYGFGWADRNKYLTRIINRDNANYYDFNHLFNKWISSRDKVATYGIYGFYYANFDYIDVNYIFDKNHKSFDLFSQNNITKILIKGGDMLWFCKTLDLIDCSSNKVRLLASYPEGVGDRCSLYSVIKIP